VRMWVSFLYHPSTHIIHGGQTRPGAGPARGPGVMTAHRL